MIVKPKRDSRTVMRRKALRRVFVASAMQVTLDVENLFLDKRTARAVLAIVLEQIARVDAELGEELKDEGGRMTDEESGPAAAERSAA